MACWKRRRRNSASPRSYQTPGSVGPLPRAARRHWVAACSLRSTWTLPPRSWWHAAAALKALMASSRRPVRYQVKPRNCSETQSSGMAWRMLRAIASACPAGARPTCLPSTSQISSCWPPRASSLKDGAAPPTLPARRIVSPFVMLTIFSPASGACALAHEGAQAGGSARSRVGGVEPRFQRGGPAGHLHRFHLARRAGRAYALAGGGVAVVSVACRAFAQAVGEGRRCAVVQQPRGALVVAQRSRHGVRAQAERPADFRLRHARWRRAFGRARIVNGRKTRRPAAAPRCWRRSGRGWACRRAGRPRRRPCSASVTPTAQASRKPKLVPVFHMASRRGCCLEGPGRATGRRIPASSRTMKARPRSSGAPHATWASAGAGAAGRPAPPRASAV
jgi:hypothetical protein